MSALTIFILPPQKKNAFSEWKGNREKSKDFVCLFLCFGLFGSFLLGFCVPVRWMRWSVWMGLSTVLSVFVQWNTCILSTSFTIKTVFKFMDLKGFKCWWLELNLNYHRIKVFYHPDQHSSFCKTPNFSLKTPNGHTQPVCTCRRSSSAELCMITDNVRGISLTTKTTSQIASSHPENMFVQKVSSVIE